MISHDDNSVYDFKDGKPFTNRFEKLIFHVRKDVNVPLEAHVMPKGNVIANVFGDYRNKLSVKCDDIVIIPTQTKAVSSAQAPIKIKQEM